MNPAALGMFLLCILATLGGIYFAIYLLQQNLRELRAYRSEVVASRETLQSCAVSAKQLISVGIQTHRDITQHLIATGAIIKPVGAKGPLALRDT